MTIFMHAPEGFHPVTAANAITAAPKEQRQSMLATVPEAWQDFVYDLASSTIKLRAYWSRKWKAGEIVPENMMKLLSAPGRPPGT